MYDSKVGEGKGQSLCDLAKRLMCVVSLNPPVTPRKMEHPDSQERMLQYRHIKYLFHTRI